MAMGSTNSFGSVSSPPHRLRAAPREPRSLVAPQTRSLGVTSARHERVYTVAVQVDHERRAAATDAMLRVFAVWLSFGLIEAALLYAKGWMLVAVEPGPPLSDVPFGGLFPAALTEMGGAAWFWWLVLFGLIGIALRVGFLIFALRRPGSVVAPPIAWLLLALAGVAGRFVALQGASGLTSLAGNAGVDAMAAFSIAQTLSSTVLAPLAWGLEVVVVVVLFVKTLRERRSPPQPSVPRSGS